MRAILLILLSCLCLNLVSCAFKSDEGKDEEIKQESTQSKTETTQTITDQNSNQKNDEQEEEEPQKPVEFDSDGDLVLDKDEISHGRNPFVADLPDIQLRFLQNYKIEVY